MHVKNLRTAGVFQNRIYQFRDNRVSHSCHQRPKLEIGLCGFNTNHTVKNSISLLNKDVKKIQVN